MVQKVLDGGPFDRISNEAPFEDVDDERVVVLDSLGGEVDDVIRVDDGLDLVERVPDVSEGQPAIDHVVEDASQTPDVRLVSDLDHLGAAAALAYVLKRQYQSSG